MTALMDQKPSFNDVTMLKLAREIAMDIHPIEDILKTHQIEPVQWEAISKHPQFDLLLRSEMEAWQSAINTQERVRLKSLSFVEEALPEFYARVHDAREPLSAKTEVLKAVARFAGVGGTISGDGIIGERVSVTINLGADQQLKIEKEINPRVIESD
jgi:hypothetical protein